MTWNLPFIITASFSLPFGSSPEVFLQSCGGGGGFVGLGFWGFFLIVFFFLVLFLLSFLSFFLFSYKPRKESISVPLLLGYLSLQILPVAIVSLECLPEKKPSRSMVRRKKKKYFYYYSLLPSEVAYECMNKWVAPAPGIKLWNKRAAETAENGEEMDYCCY